MIRVVRYKIINALATIKDAQALCEDMQARGVIVFAFSNTGFAVSSYGETRVECGDLRRLVERIAKQLDTGSLPVWSVRPVPLKDKESE